MLEKSREARRNDSGLKHKTSLLNVLFALNSCLLACLYKRPARPHSICSLFNYGEILCFLKQGYLFIILNKKYEQMLA